ncbi:MAG: lipid-A-disaccharide synthase [Candidatus Omnitrophica bacterium]|nr:lipid-A-disaccharide synthase [Candidatus Omnitrophota bacterium]
MTPKNILIVAGEPSGDLYASNLVNDLKKSNPGLKFFGLGGELLKGSGVDLVFESSGLAVVGVTEVLKNIFTIKAAYTSLLKRIDSTKVDLAILVDYPGFNLRLARALKKRSVPIVYYISPQVWAWGRARIRTIRESVRKIIVFFKFEEALYKKYGVDVEFVGHPLLDIVKTTLSKDEFVRRHHLSKELTIIAILPGSRAIEVKRLLPISISACRIIGERLNNTQFVIAKHPSLTKSLYEGAIENSRLDIRLVEGETYNILGSSDFAIIASGTATLEAAIIGLPFVIVYKTSLLTYLLYKLVKRTPFVGLVNIIAGKEVSPELLQYDAAPERIAGETIEILTDGKRRASMIEELKKVKFSLGVPGASSRAVQAILPFLK